MLMNDHAFNTLTHMHAEAYIVKLQSELEYLRFDSQIKKKYIIFNSG
jgi:hypothetical protein